MTGSRPRQYARPLLSARARRPAAIVLACAVLILAGGAVLVHDQYADPLDGRFGAWAISRLGGHSKTLQLVADLGQKEALIVIVAVICLACLVARRINGAVLAVVGAPAASVATEKVLKPLVGHLYAYSSYPSGHTTSFFALIATTAVLLAAPPSGKTPRMPGTFRVALVGAAVLVGCAVGIAVIGLGDHHFTDTVGGAAVGIAVVLAATFVLDLSFCRSLLGLTWLTRRPPAPDAPLRYHADPVPGDER
jgi:membrane-associated phospholipid phosphatase